uniref:LRAT domain-containing protein n=1 Tax=Poecilia reticulata TaxID=8081 RepID=A0A3P9PFT4_POERE
MMFCKVLLCSAALVLLAGSVESSSGGSAGRHGYDLSGSALTNLYNKRVHLAEAMRRPLGSLPVTLGVISHCGVRVTLADGSRWLIHKGGGYGISSQTVATDARHMSSNWRVIGSKNFRGTKTVSDLVGAGGPNYRLFGDNCHDACDNIMNQ